VRFVVPCLYRLVLTMGNHKISPDVKITAICLYEQQLLPLWQILQCVGFSCHTFFHTIKLFNETGEVVKPASHSRGQPRSLNHEDLSYLLQLIQHCPSWFLDDLQGLLESNRFISIHFSTIHRELERAGVSLKKLRKVAQERDKDLHADFIQRMAQYAPDEMTWMDETLKDEWTAIRCYGRSKKSLHASMKGVFVRGRRLTAVATMSIDGIIAGHVVEGSLCHADFLTFPKDAVVCLLLLLPYHYH